MKIDTLKRALLICREVRLTPFIWGFHGVGKSSVVKQLALANKLGFVDWRCAQLEASDIRGLPDKQSGRTVYLPPVEMPTATMTWEQYQKVLTDDPGNAFKNEVICQPQLKEGILFLDELPRGHDDVLNACFQLVYDNRVGQYALPPGWTIIAAGNYQEGYQQGGFTDPAFLDRFCHLILPNGDTTFQEWIEYETKLHQGNSDEVMKVIEFISSDLKHLDGDPQGNLGFRITPSRRSWDAVIRVENTCKSKEFGDDAKMAVIQGLIGSELATTYKNYSCPVKPRDIIEKGVNALAKELSDLSRNQLMGLMWGMVSLTRDTIKDDKYGIPAMDFARFMCKSEHKDLAAAFCHLMVGKAQGDQYDAVRRQMLSNPQIATLTAKIADKGQIKLPQSFLTRLKLDPKLYNLVVIACGGDALEIKDPAK